MDARAVRFARFTLKVPFVPAVGLFKIKAGRSLHFVARNNGRASSAEVRLRLQGLNLARESVQAQRGGRCHGGRQRTGAKRRA
ncbi:hypothetical protein SKAU_G00340940 [Synaphobranchus kaupii]|uniref:Uncharacterized protein n=1 Tax=Synaphobranchus kaupii TaxID=118154 RepID=A0A9Q1IH86_SYNKA|nr:hypothetical protein SKAU_G00340940 [Synaphobranchus kaupii]